jgi:hypothetical protein
MLEEEYTTQRTDMNEEKMIICKETKKSEVE